MSSRQLRKLRQQQELLSLQQDSTKLNAESGTEEDDEPLPQPRPSKPKFAGFAALAGDDDEDEGDDDNEEAEDHDAPEEHSPAPELATPVKSSKKSKKKKKKGKKTETTKRDEQPATADKELDEIDRAIQELNLTKQKPSIDTEPDEYDSLEHRVSELLSINFQHLKVLNEMRRLFGKEAMETAEHEDDAQASAARGRRQRQPRQQQMDIETFLRGQPGKGIPDVVLRRNPFIEGKSSWPKATAGGLTMTIIGDPKGDVVEFAFSHDKAYLQTEAQFFFLVGMYDPMKLVYFLQQYPYHISTLIQVSKIAHQDQNAAFAAELCERALFTFGRVTLSSFRKKLEEGKARLSFARPENRQFWLAGYNYIKNLIRKGTYRTALEWARLFHSIDRGDPYGLLNWIQILAIRSREAKWFLDTVDLLHYPHIGLPEQGNLLYIRQTGVLAHLQLGDRNSAKTTLKEGMLALPWLYTRLFGAINVDVPPSLWGIMPFDDDEQLRTELYVHLVADLWNNTEAIGLLQEVGSALPKQQDNVKAAYAAHGHGLVSLATARFVYLEGKPDLMSHVPRHALQATPNFDFDPLPPPEDENIFSDEKQKLPWTTNSSQERLAMAPPDIRQLMGAGVPGARVPGAIPHDELQEMERLTDDPDVPDETRGLLRRFLDMLRGHNIGGPGGADIAGADIPQMPGGWSEEDDDDDSEEFGEEWERQYVENGFDDGFNDLVDDFGDQYDDDDQEDDEDDESLPDLIPGDAVQH